MSSVGKVRDAKLIVCNKTRRFKGIAYVEFKDLESVPLVSGFDLFVDDMNNCNELNRLNLF